MSLGMMKTLPAIGLALLALSSCAPAGSDPGYATAMSPQILPPNACTRPVPAPQCPRGTSAALVATAPYDGPALGAVPPPSPGLVPVAAPAPPPQPSLPRLGSAVFGPSGVFGTVVNQTGNTAVVAPIGGGAPGIYVPNGNGTATIFQPGGVPVPVP
jgi:hypothetical protein